MVLSLYQHKDSFMIHACNVFPPRHNEPEIIDDVATYWLSRGWFLRQPYKTVPYKWDLSVEFYLVGAESGTVGRHFFSYKDLMDSTNEMLKYGRIL